MVLFRSRDERLPVYERPARASRTASPTKERYSDDEDYYSSDGDYGPYSNRSAGSSRNTSGSIASGVPMLPKRGQHPSIPRIARVYPYRLPTKVTRYLCIGLLLFIVLMISSLIRASQVENWKLANGKAETRPPPPPIWERFPFLERYYGGIRALSSFDKSNPQYPTGNELEPLGPSATQPEPQDGEGETQEQRGLPASYAWTEYSARAQEPDIKECFIDPAGKVSVPPLRYYQGRPHGFPRNVAGSYELLDLPEDICFERFGRYGPYGFGYSIKSGGLGTGENGENEGSAAVWKDTPHVDFRGVDWAEVQRRCYQANSARFKELPPKTPTSRGFFIKDDATPAKKAKRATGGAVENSEEAPTPAMTKSGKPKHTTDKSETKESQTAKSDNDKSETEESQTAKSDEDKSSDIAEKKSRTAVVIRCYDEYFFREDDIASIRSMITELSLASGGRYDVHLLVQVKNDAAHPIWADHEAYEKRIQDTIPEEFRGLVTLWTETQMLSLYQGIYDHFSRGPDLPVHGVYRGLSMAMQYFAYQHPEYDHFWQWEMDVRYTGHYYDLFSKIENWAKAQPRKGLWERNARFYFPEVHGSWEDFSQMARIQNEMGTIGADNVWANAPGLQDDPDRARKPRKIVWGPVRPDDDNDWFEPANDPLPPPGGPEKDRYTWGVGEEADYIALNPLFDPDGTTWGLKDDITGFNTTNGGPPRRANIITTSRVSRRLLMTMHKSTAYKKQFAFPEMWPATVALHHGYKAVFAPHPLYVDRKWPVEFMAQTFNGGRDGSSGGARTSVFGDREHNLKGLSWFYNSGFGPNLYRRWLGLKVNNDGGEEFEKTADKSKQGGSVGEMPGGEGRMCLPPMLLHPVKEVELPVEEPEPEVHDENQFDPGS
ncbi:hypothetical protein ACRE_041920 [Hapsidospora chrysogenum ATCC 11550]|uniref:Major facilitator superfamily transporter n=1 Tax=Hapsidospora chrysogenum (strain ATCC 11550 / CBS 779.69 / DSM 880 / IAM 14645 / JCM 23072 / IMI 49137) TaxID=857340 RepID=A0A086T6K0_HAPC1|nr:hypothetical protein ACRE_041920 [Hapsidospora chrysogenum ATCC 11550]